MLVAARAIVARSVDLNRTCCLCQHYLPLAIASLKEPGSQYTPQVFIYLHIPTFGGYICHFLYVYVKETGCNVEIKVFFQIGDCFVRVCCLNASVVWHFGGACRWEWT